jgi:protein TonB
VARRDKRSWFVGGSLVVHLSVFFALQAAALKPEKPKLKNVEMTIIKPQPVEEPPPEPKKPIEKMKVVKQPTPEKPPEAPPPAAEPPPPPVFGLTLASTGNNPNGFNVRVGNTTMTEPGAKVDPKDVKPLSGNGEGRGPVSIAQVSKRPEKIGECPPFDPADLYPKEAREKEIEGQVKLEVTISEEGRVTDVRVTKGLGHGLDEIAANTIRKHCRFQPAEVGSEKVATKIPYTFTFVLPD